MHALRKNRNARDFREWKNADYRLHVNDRVTIKRKSSTYSPHKTKEAENVVKIHS
jgi:hypothetical protein